jgi:membrane protease YdiL (CAAX protease family)
MRSAPPSNKILTFLGITLLLTLWPYAAIIRTGTLQGVAVVALMWAPGLAALITQWITTRSVAGLGWRLGKARYLVTSFLLPLAACILVYGVAWGVGLVPFTGAVLVETVAEVTGQTLSLAMAILATVVVIFLPSLFTALGEELGWRGLLLPELARRYPFTRAALISGIIWAIFHYPVMLFADYHSGAPLWYALVMFTFAVVAISVILAWLRLKSGSVWTAAILHASHNLFVQSIFDPLTLDFGLTPYITTEFGAGLAIAYALVAFYYWRRRGEVEQIASRRADR